MSLGHLWNTKKNQYEKGPLQLCFTELGKKAVVFLCQNLIMRCHLTILAEIYGDPISFSDPVRVLSIGRNPIQVLLIRSDPVRVLSIRSDPIRSWFCKRPFKKCCDEVPIFKVESTYVYIKWLCSKYLRQAR